MLTPDGVRYLADEKPYPFHLRWLAPAVCRSDGRRWVVLAWVSAVAVCGLTGAFTGVWWGALLPLGLTGVVHFNLKHPILVDLPAMALALGATVSAEHHVLWAAIPLVLLAGCTKETSPIFAACWAFNPVLLVGLVPVGVRVISRPRAGRDPCTGPAAEALKHPFRTAWDAHKGLPLWVYVLPFGVLLAGISAGDSRLWLTLAIAYAQLLAATDLCRLYMWAFPALAVCAVGPLTGPWLPVVLIVHLVNPFRTEGL